MAAAPTIDYDALAKQHGAVSGVDYDALSKQFGGTPSTAGSSAPAADSKSAGGFLRNAGSSALRFVGDIGNAVLHPGETLEGVTGLLEGMAEKTGSPAPNGVSHQQYVDALVKTYKDRYGSFEGLKNALYTDPVGVAADIASLADGAGMIGKTAQVAADAAKFGKVADVAGAVTKGAVAVSDATNPLKVAGKIADATGASTAAGKLADAASSSLTRGALKGGFTVNTPAAEVSGAVRTLEDLGIPVSKGGQSKIEQSLADLQQAVNSRVDTAAFSGATIPRKGVLLPLQELKLRYGAQVNPTKDLADIGQVEKTFIRGNPRDIPVDKAQAMKVGTYEANAAAYGSDTAVPPQLRAQVAAEKALATGLREELEHQIPELKGLNEQQAKLLNLQGILETAVNKYQNSGGFTGNLLKGMVKPEGLGIGTATGLLTHDPIKGAAAAALNAVLSDPMIKSRLAIAINKAQQLNPGKYGIPNVANAISRVEEYRKALNPQ